MRIMVTGGCGFIGSHVIDYLLTEGHRVMAVDNFFSGSDHWLDRLPRPEIRQVDITQRRALSVAFQECKPEIVFHLAGHPYIPFCEKDPVAAYDLHVVGTHNLLALSWNSGVKRFFLASSSDVYMPSSIAHREDDSAAPSTVHGRSKLLAESLCRGALEWGWETSMTIGRIFNAVGPREMTAHLVPEIIRHTRSGRPLPSFGDDSLIRDFVDVRSLAQAIVRLTVAVEGLQICNLGSGVGITVRQMVTTILKACGKEPEVASAHKPQTRERKVLVADTRLLQQLSGTSLTAADEATILDMLLEQEQAPLPAASFAIGNGHHSRG